MQKNKIIVLSITGIIFVLLMVGMPAALARFNDVPENHPQVQAIKNFEMKRVIQGYSDGTFLP